MRTWEQTSQCGPSWRLDMVWFISVIDSVASCFPEVISCLKLWKGKGWSHGRADGPCKCTKSHSSWSFHMTPWLPWPVSNPPWFPKGIAWQHFHPSPTNGIVWIHPSDSIPEKATARVLMGVIVGHSKVPGQIDRNPWLKYELFLCRFWLVSTQGLRIQTKGSGTEKGHHFLWAKARSESSNDQYSLQSWVATATDVALTKSFVDGQAFYVVHPPWRMKVSLLLLCPV